MNKNEQKKKKNDTDLHPLDDVLGGSVGGTKCELVLILGSEPLVGECRDHPGVNSGKLPAHLGLGNAERHEVFLCDPGRGQKGSELLGRAVESVVKEANDDVGVVFREARGVVVGREPAGCGCGARQSAQILRRYVAVSHFFF